MVQKRQLQETAEISQNENIDKAFSTVSPDSIIEIGTYQGGFALWLRDKFPDAHILTVDNHRHSDIDFEKYNIDFHQQPYQIPKMLPIFREHIRKGKCLILCDNGNKADEMAFFARWMKRGDLIGVHDYCEDRDNFEPVYWDCCEVDTRMISNTVIMNRLKEFNKELFLSAAWGMFVRL